MAIFDENDPNKTLADVLGTQADTASMGIENAYNKTRRKAIGQQAHAGRLGSGVSNYTFGDINASELGDLGNVQSGLASALGQIPAQDYQDTQDAERKRQLALLVADLSQSSDLEKAFGAAGSVLNIGGKVAAIVK